MKQTCERGAPSNAKGTGKDQIKQAEKFKSWSAKRFSFAMVLHWIKFLVAPSDTEATMEELSVFSQLVEGIYDSSLDAALWPEVLKQICIFVRGCATALNYSSFAPSPSFFHSWGYDPRFLQLYQEVYAKLNPFFPAFLFLDVGEVYYAHEIGPMDEFRSTRLSKEWARPQGFLNAMQTNLERTTAGVAVISVRGRERDGLFDADAKARFAMIVPHVRRAIAIGKVVDFHKANETALTAALDGLDAAVLLVAPDGRRVHLNAAGTAMLTTADVLRAPKGRLAAADSRANSELQQAISAAAKGDAGLGAKAGNRCETILPDGR